MSEVRKLLIVGGVAGGASAAARARRLDDSLQIIVFERGPYVSFANCGLPYHLSGEISDRDALLLHSPESLTARFGLDVRVNNEVLAIDRAQRRVQVLNHQTGERYEEDYDALILAPGAAPRRPALPGMDDARLFTLRTVPDLDRLLASLTPDVSHVTVAGAGFIGLETVEALRHRGLQVSLIERSQQVLTPLDAEMAAPLLAELHQHKVHTLLGTTLSKVIPGRRLRLEFDQGESLETDRLILALGVLPETGLARAAGLQLGNSGAIAVDAWQRTSDPHIYAVGDVVEVRHVVHGLPVMLPLAGPANRQGRIAADAIVRGPHARQSYRGSQGTAICKLFGLTAASTGLNEKSLQAAGLPWHCLYLHGHDHATYYPGASPVHLKLLFSAQDGRLLGAQAVGEKGVDKRIDVLAVALQAGMTVDDLAEMELCYSPPYGSAKDLLNLAGMAGQNLQDGLLRLIQPAELAAMADRVQLIDVREAEEASSGMIAGARNLPLSQLRQLQHLLDPQRPVVVYCAIGLRGYIASRHLQAQGFDVRSLNGGYRSWQMWQAAQCAMPEALPA